MSGIEQAIAALLEKNATVESVAKTLGPIEGHRAAGFTVKANDSRFSEILIGSSGSEASSAVPGFVRIQFAPNSAMHDFAGLCDAWKSVPNTPGASPFVYGCQAKGSTAKVSVNILVTLSEDINSPQTHVVAMTLQRGAW